MYTFFLFKQKLFTFFTKKYLYLSYFVYFQSLYHFCLLLLSPMNKLRNLYHSSLLRNTSKLLTANIIAQAVGLLIYPVLSRLFSQDDFGLANLFMSIGGVLLILSTAEYQNAIPLPQDNKKAISLFHFSALILLSLTIILALSIPFSHSISHLFRTPDLARFWFLMPIYILSVGLWQLLSGWFTRTKQFGSIATYQLSQNLLSAAARTLFGLLKTIGGLLYGFVLAPLIALFTTIFSGLHTIRPLFRFDRSALLPAAREYRKFPLFSQPRSLLNTLSSNLPILLLTPHFSLTQIGLLGMAFTLALRPIVTVNSSLYQVLFQSTASKVANRQSIRKDYQRFFLYSLAILIPSFLLLYAVLPTLTQWLLGQEWRETGEIIRYFLPWLLAVFIGGSIAFLPEVFLKQHISLYIEIAYLILRCLALLIGIWQHSFTLAIALFSLVGLLVVTAQLLWYMHLIRSYEATIKQ